MVKKKKHIEAIDMFTFAWSVERHNSQLGAHQKYTAETVNEQTLEKRGVLLSAAPRNLKRQHYFYG